MDYSIRNIGERSPVKYIKRNRLDPSGPPPAVGAACFSEQYVGVKGSQQLGLPQRQKVESDVYGNEYLAVDPSAANTKEIIVKGAEVRGSRSYKVAVEKIKQFFPHPLYADTIECEELFYEFCSLMGLNNCCSSQTKVEDGVFLHGYEVEFFSGSFYWVGTVGEFMPRHNAAKELAFALACVKLIEELRYELKSRLEGKYSEAKKTEDSEHCVETNKKETREVWIESSTTFAMVKSRQRFIPTVPKNSGYGLRGLSYPPPRPLMDFANLPKYRPRYQQRFRAPAHILASSPNTKPDAFGNVNEVVGSAVNLEHQELRCKVKLTSIAMTSDSVNLVTPPELTCSSNNPDYEDINNNQTDIEVQNGVSRDDTPMSLAADGSLSEARLDVAEDSKGACVIMAERTYESNANKHSNANTHQQVHGTNAETSMCVLRDKILRSVSPQCQLPSVSKCFYNGVCLERRHTTENTTDDVSANEFKPNFVRDAMSCDEGSKKVNTKEQNPNPNTVHDTSSCKQIPEKVGTEESKPVASKSALDIIRTNYGYGYDDSDEESIKWQSSEPCGKSNKKIAQIPFTGFTSFEENNGCNQTTSSVLIPKLIQKPFSRNNEERSCLNETHVSNYCQVAEQYKKERHSVSLRHQEEQFSSTSLLPPPRKQLRNSCKTYYQNARFGNYPPIQRPVLRLPRSQHVGPRRQGPDSAVSPRNSAFYQQPRLTVPPTREFRNSNSSNFSHSPVQKTSSENHHDSGNLSIMTFSEFINLRKQSFS